MPLAHSLHGPACTLPPTHSIHRSLPPGMLIRIIRVGRGRSGRMCGYGYRGDRDTYWHEDARVEVDIGAGLSLMRGEGRATCNGTGMASRHVCQAQDLTLTLTLIRVWPPATCAKRRTGPYGAFAGTSRPP